MKLRPALPTDAPDIQAIFAHHVLNGTGTFEDIPPPVEGIEALLRRITAAGFAFPVAEDATGVLGYAWYEPFGALAAWRHTAADSVYVRDDVRGQGVGRALVASLLDHAAERGFRQMVAAIGDSDNVGSIGLHAALGFARVGLLKAAGFKHGRWLDVVYMQKALGAGGRTRPA